MHKCDSNGNYRAYACQADWLASGGASEIQVDAGDAIHYR